MNISPLFLLPTTLMATSVAPHWDPPMVILGKLAAIAALVALNAFFVACEFSVVKVRTTQLDALLEEGNLRARLVKHVRVHLDAYLSATQLGITLASLALGWIGEQSLLCTSTRTPWQLRLPSRLLSPGSLFCTSCLENSHQNTSQFPNRCRWHFA